MENGTVVVRSTIPASEQVSPDPEILKKESDQKDNFTHIYRAARVHIKGQ